MSASLHSGDNLLDRQAVHLHWLLRTPLALVMLDQGVDHWLPGPAAFASPSGLPVAVSGLASGLDLLSGTALLLGAWLGGWLTRAGAAAALPVLLGAILMVHWGQWHSLPSASHPLGGVAFPVTLSCLAIYLLVRGNEV